MSNLTYIYFHHGYGGNLRFGEGENRMYPNGCHKYRKFIELLKSLNLTLMEDTVDVKDHSNCVCGFYTDTCIHYNNKNIYTADQLEVVGLLPVDIYGALYQYSLSRGFTNPRDSENKSRLLLDGFVMSMETISKEHAISTAKKLLKKILNMPEDYQWCHIWKSDNGVIEQISNNIIVLDVEAENG